MIPHPAFVTRMIDERAQLEDRIAKLGVFIASDEFYKLTIPHRALVQEQYMVMSNYLAILAVRIKEWSAE